MRVRMKNFEKMFPRATKEIEQMIENCRKKYPDDDAIERLTNRRVMGKIHSHLSKWYKGNEETEPPVRDKDNGQLHMASVAFWIMVTLERDLMEEDYYKGIF